MAPRLQRIGIDGRELLGNRTGVGRYLSELCYHWRQLPRGGNHRFLIYGQAAGNDPSVLGPPFDGSEAGPFNYRHVPGPPGTWWEQIHLPRAVNQDALDVFFAPAYSASLRITVPIVVTMHDVSFAAHPEWFRWREGIRRRWLAARTMRRARAVITVSDFSRQEILRHYDVHADQVHVVRSGVHIMADGLPSTTPLVLYVGSLFNRRHLPTLIQAFAKVRMRVPDAELVIVGNDQTYPKQDLLAVAQAAGVRDHVVLRAYVPEAELRALYQRARAFVFLSEYEGFGMPPLEALASGVPIVVADTALARELYGEVASLVDPNDVEGVATAIVRLLTDKALRERVLRRAAALVQTFSWKQAADQTLAVLDRAAQYRTKT